MMLMDIRTPAASGLMAAARTKDRLPGEHPPYIVAADAYARREGRERFFPFGIKDFIEHRLFSPEIGRIQLTSLDEASL